MKQNEHTENDWALCNQDHRIRRPRTGTRRDYLSEAEQDPEWQMLRKIYPRETFSPRIARSWLYRRNHRQGLILDGDLELVYGRFCLADLPAEDHPRYDEYDRPLPPRLVLPPTLEGFLDIPTLRRIIQEAVEWDDGESTRWVENKLHEELGGRYTLDDELRVVGITSGSIDARSAEIRREFYSLSKAGRLDPVEFVSQGQGWEIFHRRHLLEDRLQDGSAFADITDAEKEQVRSDLVSCPTLYQDYRYGAGGVQLEAHYGLTPDLYRKLREKFEDDYSKLVEAHRVKLLGERTRVPLDELEAERAKEEL